MVDIYTKSVLTLIAAALVTIAIQMIVRPSLAQPSDLQRVQICDDRGNCMRFTNNSYSSGEKFNALPVNVINR